MINKYVILATTLCLVLGYQNCGKKADFHPTSQNEFQKGQGLVEMPEETTQVATNDTLESQPTKDDVRAPGTKAGGTSGEKSGDKIEVVPAPEIIAEVKDSTKYVCVLDGSGKSHRLGYASNKLQGKTGTPQNVCLSAYACLKIVSTKLKVKLAEVRGFCKGHNPHIVHMDDIRVQKEIDLL